MLSFTYVRAEKKSSEIQAFKKNLPIMLNSIHPTAYWHHLAKSIQVSDMSQPTCLDIGQ